MERFVLRLFIGATVALVLSVFTFGPLAFAAGLGGSSIQTGGSGLTQARGNSLYLRLDASNDPVTGEITTSNGGVMATTSAPYLRLWKDETAGPETPTDVGQGIALGSGGDFTANNPVITLDEYDGSIFAIDGNGSLNLGSATFPTTLTDNQFPALYRVAGIYNLNSATGGSGNLALASGANAASEYGVVVGTTATTTAQTNFAVANDVDGTPSFLFTVDGSGNTSAVGNLTVDTDTLYVDATNDRAAIGTAPPTNAVFSVYGTTAPTNAFLATHDRGIYTNGDFSLASIAAVGIANQIHLLPTADTAFDARATYSSMRIGTTVTSNMTGYYYGFQAQARNYAVGGTVANVQGLLGLASSDGTGGTTTNMWGGRFRVDSNAGTITNAHAIFVQTGAALGAVTNRAGVVIDAQTGGTNNAELLIGDDVQPAGNYSIYNASTRDSLLTGNLIVDTSTLYVDATNNRVGIGTATPATQFIIVNGVTSTPIGTETLAGIQEVKTDTSSSDVISTFKTFTDVNPATSSSAIFSTLFPRMAVPAGAAAVTGSIRVVQAQFDNSSTNTIAEVRGLGANMNNNSTGTITTFRGSNMFMRNIAGGVISTLQAFRSDPGNTSTGSITTAHGFYASNPTVAAGSIGSAAGVTIEAHTTATNNTNLLLGTGTIPSGNYAIYSASTNDAYLAGKQTFDATDSSGTPGNATINKPSGKVAIAAAASAVTVTNSMVTAASIVFAVIQTNDGTCNYIDSVVPGAGTFTINVSAACTGNTTVGFVVHN